MLKTLILEGRMAKKFGREHKFQVQDMPEMLRAMCSQVKGFKKYLSEAHMKGIRFAFFNGKNNISLDEFDMTRGGVVYRIEAVLEGSKRGGILQVVIGAVALVAAYFTAGASFTVLGVTASTVTTALTGLGLSMALGGVVQLLTPQPSYNVGASSSTDNKPNYAFGAPVNTVAMGYPVPLLYGQREIGGAIISAGLFSSDQQ
ncbi:tail assembly protein [Escherichia coli]|nr:tail assembly protein [Escherichia coli]